MNQTKKIFQKDYWERKDLKKRRSPQHPIIAAYVISRINLLRKYVAINKETTLLDVGCGNGFFTYHFEQICDATGIDYSEKLIALNPAKKKMVMDANNLEFEDNSFDIVFANALLHHVDNTNRVIQEMKRVSKKYVVIFDANRNNPLLFLFSLLVKEERKALRFSKRYLIRRVENNGLRVIKSFSYGLAFPNKTPSCCLPLMKWLNFKNPFGITNFIITEKAN